MEFLINEEIVIDRLGAWRTSKELASKTQSTLDGIMNVLPILNFLLILSMVPLASACGDEENKRDMAASQSLSHQDHIDYQPIKDRTLFSVNNSKCDKVIGRWFSNCEKPRSARVSVPIKYRDVENITLTVKIKFECQSLQKSPQIIFALGRHRTSLLESSKSIQELEFVVDASLTYQTHIIESWNEDDLIHEDCLIVIEEVIFHR